MSAVRRHAREACASSRGRRADGPCRYDDPVSPGVAVRGVVRADEDQAETVIRAFAVATCFRAVAAFAAGVPIALPPPIPQLNLDLQWTTFGRLRPRR